MRLPLRIHPYTLEDGTVRIIDADENRIASYLDPQEAFAIVAAVNSHEAMKAALEETRRNIFAYDRDDGLEAFETHPLITHINVALALAKETQ